MRMLCGTILAAFVAFAAGANPLSESQTGATPEWFRKGVMYQIQPRAFTPEGTIKAAEYGVVDSFEVRVLRLARQRQSRL